MNVTELAGAFGGEVVWLVVLTGFALIASVLGGVLVVQGVTRSPLAIVAGPLLAGALVALLGRIALRGWPAADPAALHQAATTFAVVHLLAPLTIGPVALSSLGLSAFAGVREAPRRRAAPALVLASALLVAAGVWWGGGTSGNTLYAGARAGAYVVAGVVVALACAAGGESSGPVAAGGAACVFPVLVAAGEASQRGLVYLVLVGQAEGVPASRWGEGVAQMLELVHVEWVASRLAVALAAALVPAVGIAVAGRGRWWALLGAALAGALALAVLHGADLGAERAQALAVLGTIEP